MKATLRRTTRTAGIAAAAAVCLLGVAHPADAGKPGGSTGTCVRSAPDVHIVNTWAWSAPGSWGVPGQPVSYAMDVLNRDSACGTSSFTVTLSAADGFTVSAPVTIAVASGADAYAWGTVTSPVAAADGNYPVTATVARAGAAPAVSNQSVYKVYSSDTTAPKEYWMNPADGAAVSGRSLSVGFAASDDHQVAQLSITIDGATVASTSCSQSSYECQLSYAWSIRRVSGLHTATFTARDYLGNVAITKASFSVN